MEQQIYEAIKRIANYRDRLDIKFVNTQIGLYRLEAEKHWGLVRRLIHRQANDIEFNLNEAVRKWKSRFEKIGK